MTAFRLGCRESSLAWRPKHLVGELRTTDSWRSGCSRVGEGGGAALRAGQRVRLARLATRRFERRAWRGALVRQAQGPVPVLVGDKRLRLKARNLVAEEPDRMPGGSQTAEAGKVEL